MKEKLKCFKVADVSTLHISGEDAVILKKHAGAGHEEHPQVILEYEYGFMVSTWHSEEDLPNFKDKLTKLGHTPEYVSLVLRCNIGGYKWLNLDCDGEDYDDLPVFEWT